MGKIWNYILTGDWEKAKRIELYESIEKNINPQIKSTVIKEESKPNYVMMLIFFLLFCLIMGITLMYV